MESILLKRYESFVGKTSISSRSGVPWTCSRGSCVLCSHARRSFSHTSRDNSAQVEVQLTHLEIRAFYDGFGCKSATYCTLLYLPIYVEPGHVHMKVCPPFLLGSKGGEARVESLNRNLQGLFDPRRGPSDPPGG